MNSTLYTQLSNSIRKIRTGSGQQTSLVSFTVMSWFVVDDEQNNITQMYHRHVKIFKY